MILSNRVKQKAVSYLSLSLFSIYLPIFNLFLACVPQYERTRTQPCCFQSLQDIHSNEQRGARALGLKGRRSQKPLFSRLRTPQFLLSTRKNYDSDKTYTYMIHNSHNTNQNSRKVFVSGWLSSLHVYECERRNELTGTKARKKKPVRAPGRADEFLLRARSSARYLLPLGPPDGKGEEREGEGREGRRSLAPRRSRQ